MKPYNHERLKELEFAALEAVRTLNKAVVEEMRPGSLVDYKIGGRWVGPCEVIEVHPWSNGTHGSKVRVKNLESGIHRTVSNFSFNYIRPHAGGES